MEDGDAAADERRPSGGSPGERRRSSTLENGGTAVHILQVDAEEHTHAAPGVYNGVFFDVVARETPLVVTAIHFAGTRGGLRIFATRQLKSHNYAMTDWRKWVPVGITEHDDAEDASGHDAPLAAAPNQGWWRRSAPPAPARIHTDKFNTASAAIRSATVQLAHPVPIDAGCVRGFHVHLSFAEGSRLATKEVLEPGSAIARDVHASLHAGAGYVGFTPFFTRQTHGQDDGTWRDGRGFVGGISYEKQPADLATLRAEFDSRLTSLDDVAPFIGPVNLQLINEWSGTAIDPPLRTLPLPQPDPSSEPLQPPSDAPTLAELDALWTGHRALFELWRRYLGSFGWGCDVWLAEIHAVAPPLLGASRSGLRVVMLRALLAALDRKEGWPRRRTGRLRARLAAPFAKQASRNGETRPLPGEPLTLHNFEPPDEMTADGKVSSTGGERGGLPRKINAVQVSLHKADAADALGITLIDEHDGPSAAGLHPEGTEPSMEQLMTIPPPVVSLVAPDSLAERSGAIAAGQRLLAVNGVAVHGHEHGTRLLKLSSGSLVLRLSFARPRSYTGGHVPVASNGAVLAVRAQLKHAMNAYALEEETAGEAHFRRALARCQRVLLSRLATFKHSPEYAAGCRLHRALPTKCDLASFSLIRRIGRGSFGVVYAARKEDTLALYALKMVHLTRLRRLRDEEHMRLERNTLERTARLGSPFLSTLCYAFIEGPWLVLAMPLLAGGTLQCQLEERAELTRGLSEIELRWIAAQVTMGLGALHSLELLHRDIKPSNLVLRANGYYVLTDFGLSEGPGVATKTGTRGYWAPETIRQEAQSYAADWWSVGVVLAYAARGTHPFHQANDDLVDPEMDRRNAASALQQQLMHVGGANSRLRSRQEAGGQAARERAAFKAAMKKKEALLNEATLHAPIAFSEPKFSRGSGPHLKALLLKLMERDVTKRLATAAEVGEQPFLGKSVEWELLRQQSLPAPYVPNAKLVYAKDDVPPFSFHPDDDEQVRDLDDIGRRLGGWDYAVTADSQEFAEELGEYVKKFTSVSFA